jgi:hypothetical protein
LFFKFPKKEISFLQNQETRKSPINKFFSLIDIDSTKSQEDLQDPHQNINPNFQSSDNDEDGNTIIQLESLTPEDLSSKSSSENSLSNHLLEAKFPNGKNFSIGCSKKSLTCFWSSVSYFLSIFKI